ncbi:cryptochrome-1-like [Contarinia nasturtii]|uniref:cryptochrome-1-like n=1 Tax=Contarinia nasturtii TaxID=265458 RepID=UPI0012D43BCF|nr:cryptochrome-1-like [Contarinia nasturtii]
MNTSACITMTDQYKVGTSKAYHDNITITPSKVVHKERHIIHWFRRGLRLHDNPALYEGLRNCTTFRCIFILDPWFADSSNVGINKWRFLLQCLEDLDQNLKKINSRLFVVRGQATNVLPELFKEWGTTCLTFEEDPEPFGKERDQKIIKICKDLDIEVIQVVSHTLYKLEKIIEANGNRTPLTYNQFQCIIETMDPPPVAEMEISPELLKAATTPLTDDHEDRFGVPSLDELRFDTENLKPPVWQGGETEALQRMERHLERKAWVASFGRPRMTPQSLLASQTGLSPYLRFGCLSVRVFYHQLSDLYKKIKKAQPPLSLHGQLLWREFFYCAATKNGKFDRMRGNPICVQIPWEKNPEALAKWANGQTGYPWIDAIMTQLREEGWIHHLARHAVACFLTRGDLWISWEEGMKVFDELLLDADWSVNAGMWMWLSSSSFFQQFFHCYCPVRFGRRADPNGDFIRKYLPILKNFPTRYIHEPWNAPESIQKAAKCIIGRDYSMPMVDHSTASRTNIERLRQVYNQLYKYRDIKISKKESQIVLEMVKSTDKYVANSPVSLMDMHMYSRKSNYKGLLDTDECQGNQLTELGNEQHHQRIRYVENDHVESVKELKYNKRVKTLIENETNRNYISHNYLTENQDELLEETQISDQMKQQSRQNESQHQSCYEQNIGYAPNEQQNLIFCEQVECDTRNHSNRKGLENHTDSSPTYNYIIRQENAHNPNSKDNLIDAVQSNDVNHLAQHFNDRLQTHSHHNNTKTLLATYQPNDTFNG